MKLSVNSFRNVLLPLLTSLFFWSCTVIDNDLRDLPDDNPAFKQVVHTEGEGYTADYQYQPWTKILDERFASYVANVDYTAYIIYLNDYIPEDMLPKEGDVLAAAPSEQLMFGLSHKVIGVKREGDFYAVSIKPAEVKEVFKHLTYDQKANYIIKYSEEEENQYPASRGLYLEMVKTTRGDDDPPGDGDPDYDDFEDEEQQKEWAGQQKKDDPPYSNPNDPAWSRDYSQPAVKLDIAKLIATIMMGGKSLKEDDLQKGLTALGLAATNVIEYGNDQHNSYTLDYHSFMNEDLTYEGKQVGRVKIDSKTNINDAPKPCFYFKGDICMDLTFKPVVTVRNYINSDEDKYECYVYTGIEAELFFAIAAELGINRTIWNPSLASVCIGAPIGLPLWFDVSLKVDWYLAGTVNFSGKFTKKFGFKVGARQNMKKKDGKMQLIGEPKNPDGKFEANGGFNSDFNSYGGIKTGVVLSVTPTLTLGFPEKAKEIAEKAKKLKGSGAEIPVFSPNLQIKYAPSIGIEAYLGASDDETTEGDFLFHVGVPVSLTNVYLIANLTQNFSPQVDVGKAIVNAIANVLGIKEENRKYLSTFELWNHDFRLCPSVEDLSIRCSNPNDPDQIPNFEFDFDINNIGALGIGMKPSIGIYTKNSKQPVARIDDFSPLTKSDEGKHFKKRLQNNSNLKRDVAYIARVEFRNSLGLAFAKRMDFSSCSPAACISNYEMYLRRAFYPVKEVEKVWKDKYKTVEPPEDLFKTKFFDFGLRTFVMLQRPELIEELGFFVGKKQEKYVVQKPDKDDIIKQIRKLKCVNAFWMVENNKTSKRTISIMPYVKYKDKIYVQSWHDPCIANLDYYSKPRDPHYASDDGPFERVTISVDDLIYDCYAYGLDESDLWEKDGEKRLGTEVQARKDKNYTPQKVGKLISGKNGVASVLFDIDAKDLEDE